MKKPICCSLSTEWCCQSMFQFVSIKWPFSQILTHRKIFVMILAAWGFALFIGYTTVHAMNEVTYRAGTTQCEPKYPHNIVTYFHQGLGYGTCYIIPLVIMIFCYITMFKEIRVSTECFVWLWFNIVNFI